MTIRYGRNVLPPSCLAGARYACIDCGSVILTSVARNYPNELGGSKVRGHLSRFQTPTCLLHVK